MLPLFVFVAFGNALQHVFWSLRFGSYAPGVATAALAVAPATLYVSWRALREGFVSSWFLGASYALAIIPLTSAVRAGGTLLPEHLTMHRFFVRLSGWLWDAA